MTLPLAHAGHYALWVVYLVPVLVVIAGIVRSAMVGRRDRDGRDE
ncbi:MAG TPA: hypothetical protein VFX45_03925 [Solirubrobacterales bacterium]|nr:hypothetical protein [Solirubrobacterales bacterium]